MEFTMRLRAVALCVMLLVTGLTAFAQPQTMTLEQAKNTALERNLSVIQAQNINDAAGSGTLAAYGRYLPSLGGSGSWNRRQVEGPTYIQGVAIPGSNTKATTGSFSASLNTSLTLFDGFSRESNLNRANSVFSQDNLSVIRTRQSIVFQVESSYLNVLRLEQLVRVSEENLKRDRRQLERITESNRVGALSLADVYRQQSQVAVDELAQINAQNDFDKGKADLVALIGLDIAGEFAFADSTVTGSIDSIDMATTRVKYQNLVDLTRRALVARADFQSVKVGLDAAESGVTSARAGYFPSLSANAGVTVNNEEFSNLFDFKSFYWGVQLSWALFDGFGTNAAIQNAVATKRNAEITLAQTERSIGVEVKKGLLDLDAAMKQYEVSQKGLISASEDRKIAEERYNLGAGTLLDLLTANAGLVNAEANLVNASYNYIIAKRNVEYVLGERAY
jgi:outer membrane protein